MINIVLFQPEIPQNTGNIARTCACTGSTLHLIKPLFKTEDKHLKRAGLDYWDKLDVFYYDSIEEFFEKTNGGDYFFCETTALKNYTDIKYPKNCYILFGKETAGLPADLIKDNPHRSVKIPMSQSLRSLNLSNSVAVVLYEALRQLCFENLH